VTKCRTFAVNAAGATGTAWHGTMPYPPPSFFFFLLLLLLLLLLLRAAAVAAAAGSASQQSRFVPLHHAAQKQAHSLSGVMHVIGPADLMGNTVTTTTSYIHTSQ